MSDRPAIAQGDLDILLTEAASGMIDRERADHLVREFQVVLGFIEMNFILDRDSGIYLDGDRKACIAMLQEMAGTSQ